MISRVGWVAVFLATQHLLNDLPAKAGRFSWRGINPSLKRFAPAKSEHQFQSLGVSAKENSAIAVSDQVTSALAFLGLCNLLIPKPERSTGYAPSKAA